MKELKTIDLSYKDSTIESFTFFKKISDKYVYLIALLVAFLIASFGIYIFLIPTLFLKFGLNTEAFTEENIYKYCGLPYLLADIPLLIVAIIIFRKELKNDFIEFKNHIIKNLIIIVITVAAIIGFGYLFGFIYNVLNMSGDSTNESAINMSINGAYKWPMIIHILITGTFVEELIYRKFLFGFLNKTRIKEIFKIIIAILVFALVHVIGQDFSDATSLLYIVNYIVLSSCILLPYYFSNKNIYTSFVCHFANNLLGVLEFLGVASVIFIK